MLRLLFVAYLIINLLNCRSDVLGQMMPLVGKDWTQLGVTRLFSAIKVLGFLSFDQ